eukprot:TCONS_00056726-protein
MILEEPVKVAVWQALNSYCFNDAVFLAERLYAEVKNEELLYLLATTYHRSSQTKRAYHHLKNNTFTSIHNRYLFAVICYQLDKLREAELALTGIYNPINPKTPTAIASEFGSMAGMALQLLGNIYKKSESIPRAVAHYKQSLKCNPFLWHSYECLCNLGEKVDPTDYFKRMDSGKISPLFQSGNTPFQLPQPQVSPLNPLPQYDNTPSENQDPTKAVPLLTSTVIKTSTKGFTCQSIINKSTPDIEMPPPSSIGRNARQRILRSQASPVTPSFGLLPETVSPIVDGGGGGTPMFITPPISSLSSKVPTKAPQKAPSKKTTIKCTSSQKPSNHSDVSTPSQSPRESDGGALHGLRRSSRLFGSASSSRDMKRTPKVKFDDNVKVGVTPGRKTKSRVSRPITTTPLTPTSQNIQVTTSCTTGGKHKQINTHKEIKDEKPTLPSPIQQSADGLMKLLVDIGKAYSAMATYDCRKAIELLEQLPLHQLTTSCMLEKLAICYYESGNNDMAEKAFGKVQELDPCYIDEGMAMFSSLLWLTRKEMRLSSLAQNLVDHDKNSPVAWCAMANCFSLQKEHDQAIKYLERAIQLKPDLAYAYTLLGHEYVFTDENERALSCFRSAIRYNERHYNAWYGIGMIYYKQEKYTLAEQHYQKALKIHPKHSVLLCNLAVVSKGIIR